MVFSCLLLSGLSYSYAQITVPLPGRNLVKLLPDYARPRVYALDSGAMLNRGKLLALNPTNGSILAEITVGMNPTDMAMASGGAALYVINTGSRTISRVDLGTFNVTAEKTISTPNTYSPSNPLHIAAGRSNLVYFTDGAWAPSITTFDFARGTNVVVDDDGNGAGGILCGQSGSTLYRWRQYGWGAGNVNSWLSRYDIYTNLHLTLLEDSFTSWRRDPFDTPIFLDLAETRVFNKQQMFSATNVSVLISQFSESIYAITWDGSLAFGNTQIFNANSGASMTNLDFSATVQTVNRDQSRLFRYNASTTNLVIYDMASIIPTSSPPLIPTPADGAALLQLANLEWSATPVGLAYDVYFGTNQTAVGTAKTESQWYRGRVTDPTLAVNQQLSPGATYFWRVDVVGYNSTNTGPVWSFTVSPLSVTPDPVYLTSLAGYNPLPTNFSLASATPLEWTASVQGSNWMTLDVTNGSSPSSLPLAFNTTTLPAGLYTNQVEFSVAGLKVSVPIQLNVQALNITKMATDYERPYIYALQVPASSGQNGQLLIINATNQSLVKTLTIGDNPTDLAVHRGEGRLYIANWGQNYTYVVDLGSLALLAPLRLGTDVFKVNAGKPGRIITEGLSSVIAVNVIDTATGATVGSMPSPQMEGDGESSTAGDVYYHADDNMQTARIHKYRLTNDEATAVVGSVEHSYPTRNLVLSPDGTTLFWSGHVYDTDLNESGNFGEDIYATTAHGDLALGGSHVFSVHAGQTVYTWPFASTVMAVAGDENRVFLFNGATKQLTNILMSSIASVPGPGVNPMPADGAVVALPPTNLSWSLSPFGVAYDVYFGTNQTEVGAATVSSPWYRGRVLNATLPMSQALSPGAVYYWRVDVVGFSATNMGSVWSFTVSPLSITPDQVNLTAFAGYDVFPTNISIASATPLGWTASVKGANWLTLGATNGASPSSLRLVFGTAALPAGIYTNLIEINVAGLEVTVPVQVNVQALNITKMATDDERPYIYALQAPASSGQNGQLLIINTTNQSLVKALPIGNNPTDLTVHRGEGRLYIANWGQNFTHVVDLATLTLLPPLQLGTDIYKINAGKPGRIITEGLDQWIAVNIVDTVTGTNVGALPYPQRQGDGEASPAGDFYYHCDDNISNASIHKYRLTNDVATQVAGSFQHPYGSRNLVLSPDGKTLFWRGFLYDADLNEYGNLGEEIYATTVHGDLALGGGHVFNTRNGQTLYTWPFASTVMAVAGDEKQVFLFNGATRQLTNILMSSIAGVPGPGSNPMPTDGVVVALPPTNLSWSVSPFGVAYDVYFGTNQTDVGTAMPVSSCYLGRGTQPGRALLPPPAAGGTYYWRVDVVGFSATNTGPVWSFTVSPLSITPNQLSLTSLAGYNTFSTVLSLASGTPLAWTASVTGSSWMTLGMTNGTSPSSLPLAFDTAALPAGTYTNRIEISVAGLKVTVPVQLNVLALNITKMATDYERPYIYALQAPSLSGQNGQLLVINATNQALVKALTIGNNPTDLTVHRGEGRLYIANWGQNATYVVDLTSLALLPSLQLGTDIYKINAGRPGRIIIETRDQWVAVNIVDTTTGATVGAMPWPQRQGDGESSAAGDVYYHCDDNISNAGIHKYRLTNDVATQVAVSLQNTYGRRNLVLSPDGTTLFWEGFVYDSDLNQYGNLREEIYASTAHGDLALGGSHVLNARNGQTVYTWPFASTAMAVAGDEKRVFLFNGTTKQLTNILMSTIASVPSPGMNPAPPDGAVVNPPLSRLSWTAGPAAFSYHLYFGTNQAAVAAATTNSPYYFGLTVSNYFDLPAVVTPGATYYWRVDAVGFSGVTKGVVWSFTASLVNVSPQQLSFKGVAGLPLLPQPLSLSAPTPTTWTMSMAQPWTALSATNGVTPANVTLNCAVTNLPAGYYTNQLSVMANGITLQLPVVVQLFDLNASKMVADPNRGMIYAIHPGSGSFDDAFLLFLNTTNGAVQKVMPIGTNPTDLAVHPREDRLYVSNWQHNQTRVVNLVTQTELPPLALGTDVFKINAGPYGRIIYEEEDQWIYMYLVDSSTGSTISSAVVREGDGECDPTGRYYYHVDNNSSGAGIYKYDLIANTFTTVASAGKHNGFGSRNLVMSLDGSRLFWTGAMYDANLYDFGVIGDEIYACSTNGAVAFSSTKAYDTVTKQIVWNLPVSSSVMAVDRDDTSLWYFNSATKRIESLPLTLVRVPTITRQPASNVVLRLASATFTVAVQGVSPLSYQWRFFGKNLPGATNDTLTIPSVQEGNAGDYDVVVRGPYGAVTSLVATLTVMDPMITSQPASLTRNFGSAASFSVSAVGNSPLTYQWFKAGAALANGDKYSGAATSTLTVSNVLGSDAGGYSAVVSGAYGSVTSQVATLSVVDPFITGQPTNQKLQAGQTATFTVGGAGTAPLLYRWFKDNTPLSGGGNVSGVNSSNLLVSNLSSSDSGAYRSVITGPFGSVTSAVAILSVNMAPVDASFNPAAVGSVAALAVQPDQRILVAGQISSLAGQPRNGIGRLNPNGSPDTSFNANMAQNASVYSLLVQNDGRIVVGGSFTTVAGQARTNLARLLPSGGLDTNFTTTVNGTVYSLAVQTDGKFLVGGSFSVLGGQPRANLARINEDGSLDTNFITAANGTVYSVALQSDGKILLGGAFSTVGGREHGRIARINPDGTLDDAFTPVASSTVASVTLQADGSILVAGLFSGVSGLPHNRIARLFSDGSVDGSFNPNVSGNVVASLAVQTDGRILMGGNFTGVNDQPRNALARLNPDGTLDSAFIPDPNNSCYVLALQADGRLLVSGSFTTITGQPRSGLARLTATAPAIQTLAVLDKTITWLRSGTAPEAWRATFDYSPDGTAWTNLGNGARVVSGWQLTNVTIPMAGQLRARAFLTSGQGNGSGGIVETILVSPTVTAQPAPQVVVPDGNASFAVSATGTAPLGYQWLFNGSPLRDGASISGATNTSLCVNNIGPSLEGGYSVIVSNPYGALTSSIAPLRITPRAVSLGGTNAIAGGTVTVPVYLLSDNSENALAFSVAYDTNVLSFTGVTNGVDTPDAVCSAQAGSGRVGVSIARPAGAAFTPGQYSVANLSFRIAAVTNTMATSLTFGDQPLIRLVRDTNGVALPSVYVPAGVTVLAPNTVTLSGSSSLFQQVIRVTNPGNAGGAVKGVRLWFYDLGVDAKGYPIRVYNATGTSNGVPYISYNAPLAPGQSVNLTVEYYIADRKTMPQPRIEVEFVGSQTFIVPEGTVVGVGFTMVGGGGLIELRTLAGHTYYVQYTDDPSGAGGWKTALPAITGTAGVIQWIDDGPPKTDRAPVDAPIRLYRVLLIP
jgi:uncharacterized delta-60 repeat protein